MGKYRPSHAPLSRHAVRRMTHRGITSEAVELALTYGRAIYTRGAIVYAIGRKEVARVRQLDAIDLTPFEGVQVVCTTVDDHILTVYKNRDFRKLRPKLGRRFSLEARSA